MNLSPFLTLIFAAGLAFAESPEAPPAASGPTPGLTPSEDLQLPLLSETGKRRLRQNVVTLEENLRDLRTNLETTEKNLATIRAELKDLQALEKEHFELKKKYEAYLARADSELRKNETARRDLARWEGSHRQSKRGAPEDPGLRDRMEAARLEQADRERWKMDAEGKTARVKELLAGIEKNIGDIRSRRKPLEQQLSLWSDRRAEYQKLVSETVDKKNKWERMLTR